MLEVKKGGKLPPRKTSNREDYAQAAESMQINDYVVTIDKKTTTGLLRALERLDRVGAQRTIDGTLTVWRVK